MNVVVLAGGVGGARFLRALTEAGRDVTAVVNVGDDLDVYGLRVCPDLDTVLYTLAGLGDDERGWGRANETWHALETLRELGADGWFALGDRDVGLQLVRTEALRRGDPLSGVTARLAAALRVSTPLLPATDDQLRTWVETPAGAFAFQEWYVRRGHRDDVDAVRFEGAETARPAPGVVEALAAADLIAIAPSNPYLSIAPILSVAGIRSALEQRRAPAVAVSPLIGGRAVKGPAARMLERLAGGTTPAHVASCYAGLVDALVIDPADADEAGAVEALGIRAVVVPTLMDEPAQRRRLAEAVLERAGAVV
ncbi:MAG: 2-phospho-L-lactate transferase [Thermoleophilia bacterium]|nr:2-phospho-L-lactate transferase [Thermoleophilia bacterium]